jgi:hypothetical protein
MTAEDHLSSFLSFFLVDGCGIIGLAVVWLYATRRQKQEEKRGRIADAAAEERRQIAAGPIILHGRVEYAQGASEAVRVDIEQEGTEAENSGVWSHKWTEKNRRVHVHPFYLRLDSGERIRIEPTSQVLLVDTMDGLIRVDLTKRVKFAQLTPGEWVYAAGELVQARDPEANGQGGGYRSAPETLVLRPRRGEPMLLSSEPLGDRYRKRAEFHASNARWIFGIALALQVIFCAFQVRCFLGKTEMLPITRLERYITTSDGDDVTRYRVHVQTRSGDQISDHVNAATFVQLKDGDYVPFRVVPGIFSRVSTIGEEITVTWYALLFSVVLGMAVFGYRKAEREAGDWYEREVVDSEKGRLHETMADEEGPAAPS